MNTATPLDDRAPIIASAAPRRRNRRLRAALVGAVAVAAVGVAGQHVTASPSGGHEARMSAIPTPCDGFSDCIYTAYWYAFLR